MLIIELQSCHRQIDTFNANLAMWDKTIDTCVQVYAVKRYYMVHTFELFSMQVCKSEAYLHAGL